MESRRSLLSHGKLVLSMRRGLSKVNLQKKIFPTMGTEGITLSTTLSPNVARKAGPGKKQTGWCSDNETGGGDDKAER
jgi:hypothetical protein